MKKLSIVIALAILLTPVVTYAGVQHWKDNEDYHIDRYEDTKYGTVCYIVSNNSNFRQQPTVSCVKN